MVYLNAMRYSEHARLLAHTHTETQHNTNCLSTQHGEINFREESLIREE